MKGLLVSILLVGSTLQAQEASEISVSEKRVLDKRIAERRQALLKVEIEKRGVLGTLYSINQEIKKKEGDIESVRSQLKSTQKSIEGYVGIIKKLEVSLDKQRLKLRQRLRALAKFGYQGYAQMLLSSKNGMELSRNMKFLKIVSQKDQLLIQNFKENISTLTTQKEQLRDKVKVFAKFDKQLSDEQKLLLEQRHRQEAVIKNIENEKDSHLMALRELREASQKLERQMASLGPSAQSENREAFFEQKGLLKLPVVREILQGYGMIHNSRFNTEVFHKGLFFGAHPGDLIRSVYDGIVAFAGWLDGYGETLIIDHGDHYYSLYAHNQKLLKSKGDKTKLGEAVAESGDTGSLRGPGLYFELRHFSETLDPAQWLDLPRAKVSPRTLF